MKLRNLAVLGTMLAALLLAQQKSTPVQANSGLYVTPGQLNSAIREPLRVLGDRVQKPGNERIQLTGAITDANGKCNSQILIELGAKVRIDRNCGSRSSVAFDGQSTSNAGGNNDIDKDALESLSDDLAETLLTAVARGQGFRLIGRGFPDSITGGKCDLYEVMMTAKAKGKPENQLKRYCFDSHTMLLKRVLHFTGGGKGGGASVETRFAGWQVVNGQAVPGQITRMEGGKTVFQFQMQSAALSSTLADTAFRATGGAQ